MSKDYKYKSAYGIVVSVLFYLSQFVLPVAAQIKNSTEMDKTQTEISANPCRLTGHFHSINSVNITPDGKIFISASGDNNIKFWDLYTGKLIRTFQGAGYRGLMSPDGKILISASHDETIKLWDINTGKLIRTLEGHSDLIQSLAISQDGKILISGSWDKTIKLWDISTGKLIRTLRGHSEWVNSAIITPDGATVISGSSDKTIKLWDIKTAKEIRTFGKGHFDGVSALAISADGKTFLSGSYDSTIKVWDIKTGKEIRTLKGHSDTIESLAISSDGNTLVSGAWDTTIKLWDIKTGKLLRTFGKPIRKLQLSSLPKNPPSGTIITDAGSPTTIAISPDGNTIVSASNSNIQLWDIKTGQQIHNIEGHRNWFYFVAMTPDNQTLVSLNSDASINLWNVRTKKKIRSIKDSWVRSVAISPDGNTLVSGGWGDKALKLWDIHTGKLIRTFEDNGVNSVAISPDGTILISSHGETIKLRDIRTGKLLHTLKGHSFSVNAICAQRSSGAIAISKNSSTLVSSSIGDEIILSDMRTGKPIRTLKETTVEEWENNTSRVSPVISISISPDGRTVASGYGDGALSIALP